MRETQEICPMIERAFHQFGLPRKLHKKFLKQIPCVLLVSGEVQQKAEQSLCVTIIQLLQIHHRPHSPFLARRGCGVNLSTRPSLPCRSSPTSKSHPISFAASTIPRWAPAAVCL